MADKAGQQRLEAHVGHGIPYGFFEISDGASLSIWRKGELGKIASML